MLFFFVDTGDSKTSSMATFSSIESAGLGDPFLLSKSSSFKDLLYADLLGVLVGDSKGLLLPVLECFIKSETFILPRKGDLDSSRCLIADIEFSFCNFMTLTAPFSRVGLFDNLRLVS